MTGQIICCLYIVSSFHSWMPKIIHGVFGLVIKTLNVCQQPKHGTIELFEATQTLNFQVKHWP